MARIRSIHPGFCTSLDVAELSRDAQLHFVRLWTHCDDHGRCLDDPRLIKAACWPLDDDIDVNRTEALMRELQATNHVVRYRHEGRSYAQVVNWAAYQKPQHPKPSQFPPPPAENPAPPAVLEAVSKPHENIMNVPADEVTGEGEGEGEGEGDIDIALRPKPPERKTKTLTKPRPPDPVWDASCECEPVTNDAERKARNEACRLLRQSLDGAGVADDYATRHAAVLELWDRYPDAMPPGNRRTFNAVARNVGKVLNHAVGRNTPKPEVAGYGVVG